MHFAEIRQIGRTRFWVNVASSIYNIVCAYAVYIDYIFSTTRVRLRWTSFVRWIRSSLNILKLKFAFHRDEWRSFMCVSQIKIAFVETRAGTWRVYHFTVFHIVMSGFVTTTSIFSIVMTRGGLKKIKWLKWHFIGKYKAISFLLLFDSSRCFRVYKIAWTKWKAIVACDSFYVGCNIYNSMRLNAQFFSATDANRAVDIRE